MKGAFSDALTTQVRNVLEFVGETEGSEAVERLRDSGFDRFSVNTFQKLQCRPDERGYLCDFAVDVGLVNGVLQRTLTGRFAASQDGLVSFREVGAESARSDAPDESRQDVLAQRPIAQP
jgi:hypothetical protein